MAALLAEGVRRVDDAVAGLGRREPEAVAPADAAIKDDRRLERVYRTAMADLLAVDDLREVIARRELYRRCSRMGESVVDAAERVLYAWVKES
jgi:glutamine synthetase adenylyltransferase